MTASHPVTVPVVSPSSKSVGHQSTALDSMFSSLPPNIPVRWTKEQLETPIKELLGIHQSVYPPRRKDPRSDFSTYSKSFDSLGFGHRRHDRSESLIPLWHKAAKPRKPLSDKITWNGTGETFLTFRHGVEGHLLQAGAGYMIHDHFLRLYKEDPISCQEPSTYFENDPIWMHHKVSCDQIKFDKEFFYGLLLTAMRNISNKMLLKHQKDRDGILAWMELRRDFDYDGSAKIRLEHLEEIIHKPYDGSSPEGLAGHIDK